MPIPEELKDYAAQLGFPESETLAKIFKIIFGKKDDLKIVQALPGTLEDLVKKTGLSAKRVNEVLSELMQNAHITFDFKRPDVFRRFPAMIELRDLSLLGKNVDEALFGLWDRLVRKESADMLEALNESKIPPMVRVVPIEQSVESQDQVLDIDSARKIFKEADLISAIPCVCRLLAKKNGRGKDCPAPENSVCLQTNGFAAGVNALNLGEIITNDDAIKRIGDAEDAGLVHIVRNNVSRDMLLCNCCSCCCTGLFFHHQTNYRYAMAPSRFKVKTDIDACTGCGICVDRCQFNAISVEDVVKIDMDKCFGCGNCVITCADEALVLEEVHPKEFIRVKH